MAHFSRRDFLKTGFAAGAFAAAGRLPLKAAASTATDWVTLGKSGVKVTRLAFGTGSISGQVQRGLGQEDFTKLVRYAYDRGIRFFETAESYRDMHRMLGIALQGIPRDSYRIMSKVTTRDGVDPQAKFDELRKLANIEYFDIMLLHWQHTPTWPTDSAKWQDGILEAESKKVIVSHGASVHGLPALRQVPENKFLDVAMIRMNHTGASMDAEDYMTSGLGNVPEVTEHVKQARARRHGRDQHEAGGRRAVHQARGPSGRHALRVPERRGRLRHGGLQEHGRDRRSHRQREPGAGIEPKPDVPLG